MRLTVYAKDGVTVLASAASSGYGQGAALRLASLVPGTYYVKVEPLVANLAGTGAQYGLILFESQDIYLPIVSR